MCSWLFQFPFKTILFEYVYKPVQVQIPSVRTAGFKMKRKKTHKPQTPKESIRSGFKDSRRGKK